MVALLESSLFTVYLVGAGSKTHVGVKLDDDNLKILDDLPSSAVEMQVKSKVGVAVSVCGCVRARVHVC